MQAISSYLRIIVCDRHLCEVKRKTDLCLRYSIVYMSCGANHRLSPRLLHPAGQLSILIRTHSDRTNLVHLSS
jgi:hypothetical protein